jgi:hypothetical protein
MILASHIQTRYALADRAAVKGAKSSTNHLTYHMISSSSKLLAPMVQIPDRVNLRLNCLSVRFKTLPI